MRAATVCCPNIAIASNGPVLSVTLFSRVPWPEIRRVALDEGSRTSAALTQILLRKKYGVAAGGVSAADGSRCGASGCRRGAVDRRSGDARMLAGVSPCVRSGAGMARLDGLPFVYAAWAVRAGSIWVRCWRRFTKRNGSASRTLGRSRPMRRRICNWTPAFAAATSPTLFALIWARAIGRPAPLLHAGERARPGQPRRMSTFYPTPDPLAGRASDGTVIPSVACASG